MDELVYQGLLLTQFTDSNLGMSIKICRECLGSSPLKQYVTLLKIASVDLYMCQKFNSQQPTHNRWVQKQHALPLPCPGHAIFEVSSLTCCAHAISLMTRPYLLPVHSMSLPGHGQIIKMTVAQQAKCKWLASVQFKSNWRTQNSILSQMARPATCNPT